MLPIADDVLDLARRENFSVRAQNLDRDRPGKIIAAQRDLERVALTVSDAHAVATNVFKLERAIQLHAQRTLVQHIQGAR